MGIFLLLAFIPGYAYVMMSVITMDKKASMRLSNKLFQERKRIFIINGSITSENRNEAENTMMEIMNMKATYALKEIAMPALRKLVCNSSNPGRNRSTLLPSQL